MKKSLFLSVFAYSVIFSFIANSYPLITENKWLLFLTVPAFVVMSIFAGAFSIKTRKLRLKICNHGAIILSAFRASTTVSVFCQIYFALRYISVDFGMFFGGLLFCIAVEFLIFWNGIICVYLTSVQLGIKHRVIGVICGMIPVANLFALNSIIRTVRKEVVFEAEKEIVNLTRSEQKVCATKYPLLMVHGVFFRDSKYFNYWGRIPEELEQNGAKIFYGEHHSAASISDCGEELAERIKYIVKKTGCEKVNIIAHSKGGLDCRYAIAKCGVAPYVASLTTVNTPHRGCSFADYLLEHVSEKVKDEISGLYNKTLKKFGDEDPSFIAAVSDLTASSCARFNEEIPYPENIYCQSVGSVLKRAGGGKFPLNFSYNLVRFFDGPNDGLVSASSFEWGEKFTLLTPKKRVGISHGDMIDLNRENIEGFDVREFYVGLVSDLKNMGL